MSSTRRAWVWLSVTVATEVLATLSLKASDGLSNPLFSALAVAGYIVTVVALAQALRHIATSIAYVVWTGAGTTGVAVLGAWMFSEPLALRAWVGIALVIAGVILINTMGERNWDAREEHSQ